MTTFGRDRAISRQLMRRYERTISIPAELRSHGIVSLGDQRFRGDEAFVIPPGTTVSLIYVGPIQDLERYLRFFGEFDVDSLCLVDRRVSDSDLAPLARFRESLRTLDLRRCGLTDDAMRMLRPLQRLENLWLGKNELTGAALRNLRGMNLVELGLDKTRADDEGLRDILPLASLRHVQLDQTFVSAKAAEVLTGCINLKSLSLYDCDWWLEEVDALRAALPGCRIAGPDTPRN